MRSTVIERIQGERFVPYDENDHSRLMREGNVNQRALEIAPGRLVLLIDFDYKVRADGADGKLWGQITGRARTTITDASIQPIEGKPGEANVGDTIGQVVQGAINDDILLVAAILAKSMRLPGILQLPQPSRAEQKQREEGTRKDLAG